MEHIIQALAKSAPKEPFPDREDLQNGLIQPMPEAQAQLDLEHIKDGALLIPEDHLNDEESGLDLPSSKSSPMIFDPRDGEPNQETALVTMPVPNRWLKRTMLVALVVATGGLAGSVASFLGSDALEVFTPNLSSLTSPTAHPREGQPIVIEEVATKPITASIALEKHARIMEPAEGESLPRDIAERTIQLEVASTAIAGTHAEAADSPERELASARDELKALLAKVQAAEFAAARATEAEAQIQQVLGQERTKTDRTLRDLEAARGEVKAVAAQKQEVQLTAARATEAAARSEQALNQERMRADRTIRELEAARDEIKALAVQAQAGQLAPARAVQAAAGNEQALGQERMAADRLPRELAVVRDQTEAMRASPEPAKLGAVPMPRERPQRDRSGEQKRKKLDNLAPQVPTRQAMQIGERSSSGLSAGSFFWKEKREQ